MIEWSYIPPDVLTQVTPSGHQLEATLYSEALSEQLAVFASEQRAAAEAAVARARSAFAPAEIGTQTSSGEPSSSSYSLAPSPNTVTTIPAGSPRPPSPEAGHQFGPALPPSISTPGALNAFNQLTGSIARRVSRRRARNDSPNSASSAATYPTYTYHSETKLASGRESLLVDIGSVGNIGGSSSIKSIEDQAKKSGLKPTRVTREKVLNVSGVGKTTEKCLTDSITPIAIRSADGSVIKADFRAPVIENSDVPCLLGLEALTRMKAIIDLSTNQIHLCGPGDYDLASLLPPGTKTIQCEKAPSGHMVMPCDLYNEVPVSHGVKEKNLTFPVQQKEIPKEFNKNPRKFQ